MDVKQTYELVNDVTKEVLGQEALIKEDLTNVVDLGTALFNAQAYDKYVKTLVNHIGKVIFKNRVYRGALVSVLMDSWEYGSVCEKIQADLPEATENKSWELEDGTSYDPNVFYKPSVSVKFFNSKTTFEIPMSFTDKQLKQSFSSATQLNAFVSMLYNAIEKSMTVKIDGLIMRTINNFIGETVYADYGSSAITSKSGMKAVNLLKLYNDKNSTSLTADACLTDADFLKFASMTMGLYVDRLKKMSVLFNIGAKERFTPAEDLHVVLLSEYEKATASYLQSDTYHDSLVALPNHESVPYWQGSGTDYSFANTGKVYLKTSGGHEVTVTGILGVMFDHEALGVTNVDRRTTTNYNPRAEFYSNWAKWDCAYFNDQNEQFVVFFVA